MIDENVKKETKSRQNDTTYNIKVNKDPNKGTNLKHCEELRHRNTKTIKNLGASKRKVYNKYDVTKRGRSRD